MTRVTGIIGDGQLALMLADSLKKRGLRFYCYSVNENSSMELFYPKETLKNAQLFRDSCDVFTLENEFYSVQELEELLLHKKQNLFPNLASYAHFSNKVFQRQLYQQLEIPSPLWMEVRDPDLKKIFESGLSFPFIVKAPAGGYDGKGVRVERNPSDFNSVADDFGLYLGKSLLLEEMVAIKKELAQGFVRAEDGSYTLLPLVETVQVNGICQYVYHPAPVSMEIKTQIEEILMRLMKAPLVGIFNFEFFLDDKDRVFINEGAPRPHNSQHLTMEASNFSQFDLVAMYLSSQEKVPASLETKSSAMVNILGKSDGKVYSLTLPEVSAGVSVFTKLYGKQKCSPGRKMGHVNLVDDNQTTDLREVAQKIFKEYYI
jgi:5-(carboxyamino)imidazole ribonucleotide synthase